MHLDWRLLLMVEPKATSSGDILGIYINIFQNSDSDHLLKNNLNKCNHCEQRGEITAMKFEYLSILYLASISMKILKYWDE